MLEKLVDKIRQGKRRGETSARPRRQTQSRPRPVRQDRHETPTKKPAMAMVEGTRVTSDDQYSPYASKPLREANTEPLSDGTPSRTNLKEAVIWSEILNNPKFKEF